MSEFSATGKSPVVAGLSRRGRLGAGRLVPALEPSFALILLTDQKVGWPPFVSVLRPHSSSGLLFVFFFLQSCLYFCRFLGAEYWPWVCAYWFALRIFLSFFSLFVGRKLCHEWFRDCGLLCGAWRSPDDCVFVQSLWLYGLPKVVALDMKFIFLRLYLSGSVGAIDAAGCFAFKCCLGLMSAGLLRALLPLLSSIVVDIDIVSMSVAGEYGGVSVLTAASLVGALLCCWLLS